MERKGKPYPVLTGDLCFMPGLVLLGNDQAGEMAAQERSCWGKGSRAWARCFSGISQTRPMLAWSKQAGKSRPIFCEASVRRDLHAQGVPAAMPG